jgi:hypothetical protein
MHSQIKITKSQHLNRVKIKNVFSYLKFKIASIRLTPMKLTEENEN